MQEGAFLCSHEPKTQGKNKNKKKAFVFNRPYKKTTCGGMQELIWRSGGDLPSQSSPSYDTLYPAGQFSQVYEPSEFRQIPLAHVSKDWHSSISTENTCRPA